MSGNNYIDIYMPDHPRARKNSGNILEHRLKAEEYLGRALKEEEVVHHEDGDRTNNSKENLYVFRDLSSHTRFHMTGERFKDEEGVWYSYPTITIKKCRSCGEEFESENKNRKFCGKECTNQGNRKVKNRPRKEELEELLNTYPFTKVGEIFGVSDNAIRKWCKNYGMPTDSKSYDTEYKREQLSNKVSRAKRGMGGRKVGKYSLEGELLDTYISIAEASRKNNIRGGIERVLKGDYKTSGGYIWKYEDE